MAATRDEAIAVLCSEGVSLGTAVRLAPRCVAATAAATASSSELFCDGDDDDAVVFRGFRAGLLKLRGNKALQEGRPADAAALYSSALDAVAARAAAHPDDRGRFAPSTHALLGNRCLARIAIGDADAALADADACVALAGGTWPKAHYRRAQALLKTGRVDEACAALDAGLAVPGISEVDRNAFNLMRSSLRLAAATAAVAEEEEDDDELQQALHMSLERLPATSQQQQQGTKKGEDEDEELRQALRMSMEGTTQQQQQQQHVRKTLPLVLDQSEIQRAYAEELARKQLQQSTATATTGDDVDDDDEYFELASSSEGGEEGYEDQEDDEEEGEDESNKTS